VPKILIPPARLITSVTLSTTIVVEETEVAVKLISSGIKLALTISEGIKLLVPTTVSWSVKMPALPPTSLSSKSGVEILGLLTEITNVVEVGFVTAFILNSPLWRECPQSVKLTISGRVVEEEIIVERVPEITKEGIVRV